MQIRVKFKSKNPPGKTLELPDGSTSDRVLAANDEFSALPPVGGG